MKHVNPSSTLRALARRYRQAEHVGFPDLFLIVVCGAGGLATAGVALLAFVPTHAVLALAYVLVIATTLTVLVTVVAMVNGEERADDRSPAVPEDNSATAKLAVARERVRRERRVRNSTRRRSSDG
jgi:hypothetical protein